jgi:hypothetical protein
LVADDLASGCAKNVEMHMMFDACVDADRLFMDGAAILSTDDFCDPGFLAIEVTDFTGEDAEGTFTGSMTLETTEIEVVGTPPDTDLQILGGTVTISHATVTDPDFGSVQPRLDDVTIVYSDASGVQSFDGTITVVCGTAEVPLTFTTLTPLVRDAGGAIIAGSLRVVSGGETFRVTYHADGSFDVSGEAEALVGVTDPITGDFCGS